MSSHTEKKIILDTNQILAAGSRWVDPLYHNSNSTAQELLRVIARSHRGMFCPKIMAEYVEKLLEKGHPKERVAKLIGLLLGAFEMVTVTSKTCSPVPADPDDVMFVLCAIDGAADFIVSSDKHLLDLDGAYAAFRILSSEGASIELGISVSN
ncbi:MAG: nucleic acid binding [Geobacteraceae bacterium]|nr:MAG: nucleic acid binding [Geobacteraceae bacterium]